MGNVDLQSGAHTYIASLAVKPNFSAATEAATRADRKTLAYGAMTSAEEQTKQTLVPKLDAMKAAGLLTDYEFVAGVGSVILNAPKERAAAAYDALRGASELEHVVRNREVSVSPVAMSDAPPAPPTPPTPPAGPVIEWNVEKLQVQKSWAAGFTGKGVVVGIVDTGANVQHEALKRQYRGTKADGTLDHDYNFFDAVAGKKEAYDDHNHGSHVAGTAVGGTKDRLTGMAPDASFIAAKAFNAGGSSSTATILKALGWILAPTKADGTGADPTKAPDIVSNSWGNSNGAFLDYLKVFQAFDAAGIIPVVAAGNSGPRGDSIGAPGSYSQSITVGATDKDDKVAPFSSRGPSKIKDPNGNPIPKPDLSAPGVDVVSAGKAGNSYVKMSGTSMATPAVAGVVALLLQQMPNLTTEQVRSVLTKSTIDIDAPGYDVNAGWGRIDPNAALAKARDLFPAPKPDPKPVPAPPAPTPA